MKLDTEIRQLLNKMESLGIDQVEIPRLVADAFVRLQPGMIREARCEQKLTMRDVVAKARELWPECKMNESSVYLIETLRPEKRTRFRNALVVCLALNLSPRAVLVLDPDAEALEATEQLKVYAKEARELIIEARKRLDAIDNLLASL